MQIFSVSHNTADTSIVLFCSFVDRELKVNVDDMQLDLADDVKELKWVVDRELHRDAIAQTW